MTFGLVTLLIGLFVVPVALLWLGHRLRRRTARQRAIFWGALWGHVAAMLVATVAVTIPAEGWSAQDLARGMLGYGSLVLLPLLGAVVGALNAGRPRDVRAD